MNIFIGFGVFFLAIIILLCVILFCSVNSITHKENTYEWKYDEEDPIDGYIDYFFEEDDAEASDSADE